MADASQTDHDDWHRQIKEAAHRYSIAKLRAAEASIDRLAPLDPDIGSRTQQEEILALREYSSLLQAYSRILSKESGALGCL